MGSSVSLPTGRTSFSVISANASAALRWRSTLSENESVVNAARGESLKKSVVVRSAHEGRRVEYHPVKKHMCCGVSIWHSLSRYCKRSATASRSFSNNNGSYVDLRERTVRHMLG